MTYSVSNFISLPTLMATPQWCPNDAPITYQENWPTKFTASALSACGYPTGTYDPNYYAAIDGDSFGDTGASGGNGAGGGGYPCGACAALYNSANGNSVTVMITDECPQGGINLNNCWPGSYHLDLSPSAYNVLSCGSAGCAGNFASNNNTTSDNGSTVSWKFVQCPLTGNAAITFADSTGKIAYEWANGAKSTYSPLMFLDMLFPIKSVTVNGGGQARDNTGNGNPNFWGGLSGYSGTLTVVLTSYEPSVAPVTVTVNGSSYSPIESSPPGTTSSQFNQCVTGPTSTPTKTPTIGSPTATFTNTFTMTPTATLTPISGCPNYYYNGTAPHALANGSQPYEGQTTLSETGTAAYAGDTNGMNLAFNVPINTYFAEMEWNWANYATTNDINLANFSTLEFYIDDTTAASLPMTLSVYLSDYSGAGGTPPITQSNPVTVILTTTGYQKIDIPLSSFSTGGTSYSTTDIGEIDIKWNTTAAAQTADVYFDNLAFYGTCPTATPTPTSTFTHTASFTATRTATATATPTITNTPTFSPTPSPTSSRTNSPTATVTATPSNTSASTSTPTMTPSKTPSSTATLTETGTQTGTPTNTLVNTGTPTPTASKTPTLTVTNTSTSTVGNTATLTPTSSATRTPSATPSATVTETPVNSYTPTGTPTLTATRTFTGTPGNTATQTPSSTVTSTTTATASRTATATPSATVSPTATRTATSTFSATVTDTPVNSYTPTGTPTATASSTPTGTPLATATLTPSSTVTATPTVTASATATLTATLTATATNSFTPTSSFTPTLTPTLTASGTPTATATSSQTPTFTFTLTATKTATVTSTATGTATPSFTPTPVTVSATVGISPPPNSNQLSGTSNVAVQQVVLTNPSSSTVNLSQLTLAVGGTGNPANITSVTLYANGVPVGTSTFTGTTAVFNFTGTLPASSSVTYTVSANFGAGATGTYSFSMTGAVGNNGQPAFFSGLPVAGATVTVAQATSTPTQTNTSTPSATATSTPSGTPTSTFTSTRTSTVTGTPTHTPTITNTPTATATRTVTATTTPTFPTFDVFSVSQNLFKPSNGPVSIQVAYSVFPGDYSLKIYNSAGEHILTLDSQYLTKAVTATYQWNGKNKSGQDCASGVYIFYLSEPYSKKIKRIILVR